MRSVPRPPTGRLLAAQYARRLRALLRAWLDVVDDVARPHLRQDAARADSIEDELRAAFDALFDASGLGPWLTRVAANINTANASYYARVAKVPQNQTLPRFRLEAFRDQNVRLVRGLRDSQIEALADVLRLGQAAGQRWEELAPQVKAVTGVGDRRARLIARDQVQKFNAQVAQERARDAGIVEYIWSTSKDLAVRGRPGGEYAKSKEDHWALEGTRHRYDRPPLIPGTTERAHPGERIQCRCVAIPVVDDLFGAPLRPGRR